MNSESHYRAEVFDCFERLPQPHLELLTAAPSFDQTLIWYQAFVRHLLASNERLAIVALSDRSGGAVAVLPLRVGRAHRGPLTVRSVSALTNYYTALFGPAFAAGIDLEAASAALIEGVRSALPGWNLLDLNPIASSSTFFGACQRSLRASGCVVQPYFRFGNWYLNVSGRSFAEYLQAMPGRMRSTLTRKSKKLRARSGAVIEIVQDPQRVDEALAAYEQIYLKSWKQDEPHKAFIRDIVQRFAEQGWLRLGLIRLDGAAAAAQIWFTHGGTASIFKLAYDPAFAELSVGSVLTMKLMENALDVDRVSVVDYLCGDDDYKRDWMSARRERWGLRASPWLSLVGLTEVVQAVGSRLRRLTTRPTATVNPAPADQAAA